MPGYTFLSCISCSLLAENKYHEDDDEQLCIPAQGGCTDCYNARRRMRARQPRIAAPAAGTCAGPGGSLGGLDAGDVNDGEDDVLHKVHVMLHTRMDTIRVQVCLLLRPLLCAVVLS